MEIPHGEGRRGGGEGRDFPERTERAWRLGVSTVGRSRTLPECITLGHQEVGEGAKTQTVQAKSSVVRSLARRKHNRNQEPSQVCRAQKLKTKRRKAATK
jgi:hypothetical protein